MLSSSKNISYTVYCNYSQISEECPLLDKQLFCYVEMISPSNSLSLSLSLSLYIYIYIYTHTHTQKEKERDRITGLINVDSDVKNQVLYSFFWVIPRSLNHAKESLQQSQHGERLKSRINQVLITEFAILRYLRKMEIQYKYTSISDVLDQDSLRYSKKGSCIISKK